MLAGPRPLRLRLYDGFMTQAAQHGLSVLPVLFDPASFRSSRPASGAARGTYPPASNHDFARFAAAVVQRYGSRGSFWRERPRVPRRPIRAWQVWNEPNLRDAPPYAGGRDFWGLHAGLHAQDGRPKPVVSALSRLLRLVVRR